MSTKRIIIIGILIFFVFFLGIVVSTYYENPTISSEQIISQIHVKDNFSIDNTKTNLNNFLWNQENLPNHNPNHIEQNINDERYLDFVNLDSIEKITIQMEDGVNSIAYLFHATENNNQLIIYHQGQL